MSAQPGEGTDIDIHTTAGKLADLDRRLDEAVHAGSAKAVEKQHAKGRKTARERIEMLFDEGSFVELDELARHRSTAFGLEKNRPYGDGVVTGYGTVDGRQVCVFSQDFTVFGGSLGEVYGEKITKVMDLAMKTGCPIIGINEGAGARIQEGVVSLGLYGEIFRRNVHASGVIPQISMIMGNCAGGHVYSPAVTDFTVMVDKTSAMFITGPDVIKTVTGEDVTMEDLGGARTHNSKSGNAHYMGSDEEDAIEYVKALISYLPQNNLDEAPSFDDVADTDFSDLDRALDTIIPDSPNQPYDMHDVITTVLDDEEFLEVQELFAPNIIVGFGRVEGRSVGIVANQPMQFAGCLDIDASEKAARFVRFCDAFNIPVLTFVDVPGLPPRHRPGVERHHPPRREADLRVRGGHRPAGHDHHPQGVRRRVRRDGLQAPRRRHQRRLADRADRGDGRPGRREHRPPQGAHRPGEGRRLPRTGRGPPRRADRRVRDHPRQPLHRRRARLHRRGDHPARDPRRDRPRAAAAALEASQPAGQEAREHPALMAAESDAAADPPRRSRRRHAGGGRRTGGGARQPCSRRPQPRPRRSRSGSANHRKVRRTLPHGPGGWRSSSLPR